MLYVFYILFKERREDKFMIEIKILLTTFHIVKYLSWPGSNSALPNLFTSIGKYNTLKA